MYLVVSNFPPKNALSKIKKTSLMTNVEYIKLDYHISEKLQEEV